MRRRDFLGVLSGAATVWPVVARAQTGKTVRIGFLGPSLNVAQTVAQYQAFLAELKQFGFTEGQDFTIEYRSVVDARGPFVAAGELIRSQPDLIIAAGPEVALQAVIGASRIVPIVIQAINYDPIARGYVTSLARPGGNITGLFYREPELAAKRVELLTQAFPDRTRLTVLFDALSTDSFTAAERVAKPQHLQIRSLKLESPPYDFDAAFRNMAQGGAQMVLVLSSPYFTEYRPKIATLAMQHRLPTMFIFKGYVDAGGLMSYGVDQMAMYRLTAAYVGKILKGAKPADLPIEQATKYELVVNLKTAKAIGVDLPTAILLRADAVIE